MMLKLENSVKLQLLISSLILLLVVFAISACASAGAERPDRVVAIGDVHGDFEQFVTILRDAELIDQRNKWIGGQTVLVQTGDIPDRGPDSRKAIDLLIKLKNAAVKKGGDVITLIGNHEAMNMRADLRFVHPGEYHAFKDKNSKKRREQYYQATISHLKKTIPKEELPTFDSVYKKKWQLQFPLGYVEHRIAWAPTGEYGKWVISNDAVALVGDSLFLHGGLSTETIGMTLNEINTRIRTELVSAGTLSEDALSESESGPLWYRGWAQMPETKSNELMLDSVLSHFGAKRMIIGHTPLLPVVLPRFGGKVIIVDVGLAEHYGHARSFLSIENGTPYALVGSQRLLIPNSVEGEIEYLNKASRMIENNTAIHSYIKKLEQINGEAELIPGAVAQ